MNTDAFDMSLEVVDPCIARVDQVEMECAEQKQQISKDHEVGAEDLRTLIAHYKAQAKEHKLLQKELGKEVAARKKAVLEMLYLNKVLYDKTRHISVEDSDGVPQVGQSWAEGRRRDGGGGKRRLKLKRTKRKKKPRKKQNVRKRNVKRINKIINV